MTCNSSDNNKKPKDFSGRLHENQIGLIKVTHSPTQKKLLPPNWYTPEKRMGNIISCAVAVIFSLGTISLDQCFRFGTTSLWPPPPSPPPVPTTVPMIMTSSPVAPSSSPITSSPVQPTPYPATNSPVTSVPILDNDCGGYHTVVVDFERLPADGGATSSGITIDFDCDDNIIHLVSGENCHSTADPAIVTCIDPPLGTTIIACCEFVLIDGTTMEVTSTLDSSQVGSTLVVNALASDGGGSHAVDGVHCVRDFEVDSTRAVNCTMDSGESGWAYYEW